ncbi:hypothetical protein BJ944DRAFT_245019 [Cunninghamella echinulata]|nr:hypothetical protein BJ944DRAFT_245019 [Cunninghamella echinulata]
MNPTPPASITSSSSTDSPSSSLDSLHNLPPSHHLSNTTTTTTSYPLQENMDFPDYLNGGPLSPSPSPHHDFQSVPLSHPLDNSNDNGMTTSSTALPTLVSVPDAGPTAMLTTGSSSSSPSNDHLMSTPATTPPTSLVEQPTVSPQDIWPASIYHTNLMRSQSVAAIPMATSNSEFSSTHLERSLSNPPVTTIDPSNLMMNHRLSATPPVENATISTTTQENNTDNNNKSINTNDSSSNSSSEIYDVYLNCTTLTIGTWHRLKLRASDLLCVLKDNVFEWHIEDAGCHFKMEIALSSVASIDFVEESNGLADVHFDISESPLFYMETTNNNNNNNNENNTSASSSTWVQCSDFTEGKQASRFFRHSLKGVSQHLKQDLMTLMDKCPDARRWVRFLDPLSSTTTTHPHQHQHTTSHFQPSYPLTTFDPMLTTGTHPFNPSNPLMATTMTPPPPPPPSHPNASSYLHPSYWSSMYSQTPMMMGVSNYLV